MVPDASLRIECIKRALLSSILPFIPENEKTSQEQFKLIVSSLDMLCSQLPYLHAFEVSEALCLSQLLEKMTLVLSESTLGEADTRLIDECRKTAYECRVDANNVLLPTTILQSHSRNLREYVDKVMKLAEQHGDAIFNKMARTIIDFEKDHLTRERTWISASGFDANPSALLSLQEAASPRQGRNKLADIF